MPKVLANGINIHYLQSGKGDDVVLLHGLGGNLAIWFLKLVEQLRRDFRFTACDLRGHGKSDMPPTGYTTDNMAEDVGVCWMLSVWKKCIWLAIAGVLDIAMHFTILYPERAGR
jgi:alpha/beta hydrolase family protein